MNKIFNDDAISIMDKMIAKNYKVDLKNVLK
jgi:DNA modification methylase